MTTISTLLLLRSILKGINFKAIHHGDITPDITLLQYQLFNRNIAFVFQRIA